MLALFGFIRLAPSQWESLRTINFIECFNEEFSIRVKTQIVLPSSDTLTMPF